MIESVYHIPDAPRMAILADVHGRDCEEIINSVKKRSPEMIAVVGDVIYGALPADDVSPLVSQKNVMPFLKDCAKIALTYFSLGNHEWLLDEKDMEDIRATGVVVLDNEFVKTEVGGRQVVIGGLTSAAVTDYRCFLASIQTAERGELRYLRRKSLMADDKALPCKGRPKHFPETSWLSSFAAVPGYHILLSHHPEYYGLVPADIELMLSGHTHGGQWRLLGKGVFAPGQGLFPKYGCGVYENGRLVVSAGLANTARVPRILDPEEIVYLENKR